MSGVGAVQEEIAQLREENVRLRLQLSSMGAVPDAGAAATQDGAGVAPAATPPTSPAQPPPWDGLGHGLSKEQVARYSRQIILPSFGVQAQAKLCRGSVLIIGAGGLGSPAALYLAAAGVGRIGLVDRDAVELSNIHRQVIHNERSVGVHKAESAAAALRALNSSILVEPHRDGFTPANAVDLVRRYDIVVDASDNAPTRYLASDACAVAERPLVSGAAIGTDGQLTVYCAGGDAPCYRCLFPEAPAPASCARCVDAGVLGPVPGVIGTMQAVEAIKLLACIGEPMARRLLVWDALAARFHVVKLRPRAPGCVACCDAPGITAETLPGYDYAAFTGQAPSDGAPRPLRLLRAERRLTPGQLQQRLARDDGHILIDVRPPEQFSICHIPGAVNAPYKDFHSGHLEAVLERLAACESAPPPPLYVVCRRGNDSQRAVDALGRAGAGHAVDVAGGVEAWAREVDPTFPLY